MPPEAAAEKRRQEREKRVFAIRNAGEQDSQDEYQKRCFQALPIWEEFTA
jgi:hypothetical protein